MNPTQSNATVIQFHRGRPQSAIPRRKSETIDLNEDDDERYEMTQKNEDERIEDERDKQMMTIKGSTSPVSDSTSSVSFDKVKLNKQ